MKRNRHSILIGAMAGVLVFALAQMCAFAQTATKPATTTTSMLLVPEKPVADAAATKDAGATPAAAPTKAAANPHAAHTMDMAPAQSTATPLIRRGMKMHAHKWPKLPTASSNPAVTPLDPNTIPKFVNQLTR